MIRVVIVDDEDSYREGLAKKLKTTWLTCHTMGPPQSPDASQIVDAKPDVVMVDYQLTQAKGGKVNAAYFGSLLIAAIREKQAGIPVLLLTRKKLSASRKDVLGSSFSLDELFDDLILKEDIKPQQLRPKLRSLVDGYQVLRREGGTWSGVVHALATPSYAIDELRRFGMSSDQASYRPEAVARWVRKSLLRYPGLLLNELSAATELGFSLGSFRRPDVRRWFSSAEYRGVFAGEGRWWWRGALLARARALMNDSESSMDGSSGPVSAWNRRHPRREVSQSRCCNCGEPTSDAVCWSRKEPVMLRCSVPYYPDTRPSGFDIARISFKAIRESELEDEWFSSSVLPIVRQIENGEIE